MSTIKYTIRLTPPSKRSKGWTVVRVTNGGGMLHQSIGHGESMKAAAAAALDREVATFDRRGLDHPQKQK